MFKSLTYQDADKTMIYAVREDNTARVIEPTDLDLWKAAVGGVFGKVAEYKAPPAPTAKEVLAAERAAMRCRMGQLGRALVRAGAHEKAEAAFADDPETQMVWRKEAVARRSGLILKALKTFMTDKQVDELFRTAMQIDS